MAQESSPSNTTKSKLSSAGAIKKPSLKTSSSSNVCAGATAPNRSYEAKVSLPQLQERWLAEQERLKPKVIPRNVTNLSLDSVRWVAGVDISFVEDSPAACGVLVVLDRRNGYSMAHAEKAVVQHLDNPYIPGFLAFRELPLLRQVFTQLEASRTVNPEVPRPDVVMVDGNGLLHPNQFGLACHLGVELDIPVIGVAKNLHAVDGLTKSSLEDLERKALAPGADWCILTGKTLGALGAGEAIYIRLQKRFGMSFF